MNTLPSTPAGTYSDVVTTKLAKIFDVNGSLVQLDGLAILSAFVSWQRAVRFNIGDPVATFATYTSAVATFNADVIAARAAAPTANVMFQLRDIIPAHI